ncbi:MAG: ABC transporter ATP-binding protein [Acidobacteriota bacterium]|nr:ABC transporter ATP-binding protein [Acidobacteriota bacterium]
MTPVLSVAEAHKRFGDTLALDGAELQLGAGEWLALLGPNGAGKTTLVRAVAGRVRLDSGRMTLLGRSLNDDSAHGNERDQLGVVPQDIALYPQLTAAENLRAWGRLHGVPSAAIGERVRWALDWTGLESRAKEPVKRFSGGMKRRLNIACGVLHRPEIVLLDEPTVGVDPQSRERIWEMLEDIRGDGASLLLTTHQLDEAQQVCDRIVIIDHGRVIAAGTFEELLRQTIGAERRITVSLDAQPPREFAGERWQIADDETLECRVADIAVELPSLLSELSAAGARVADLHVDAPTLQAVFIHLTGRELRE